MRDFLPLFAWISLLQCILAFSSSSSTSAFSASQQLLANWFSIVSHLQNPTVYSTEWANACTYHAENQTLSASRIVDKGGVISLIPIHAIGFADWVVLDADKDGEYYHENRLDSSVASKLGKGTPKTAPLIKESPYRYIIPRMECGRQKPQIAKIPQGLFCDINPDRPIKMGWLGHLTKHSVVSSLISQDCTTRGSAIVCTSRDSTVATWYSTYL